MGRSLPTSSRGSETSGTRGRYSVVTGQGRSGTNWLLDMVDTSPETFCRSEPNALDGSPFEVLGPLWLNDVNVELWERQWDRVAALSLRSMGERDHPFPVRKDYVRSMAQKCGAIDRLHGRRSRKAMGVMMPSLRHSQWPFPAWAAAPDRLAGAHGVLKVNRANGLLRWILVARPDVPVVNIIRHPAGRHLSYTRRFLSAQDGAKVLATTHDQLRLIATHESAWKSRFGDIERMDHLESQMWIWRYVNESLEETGEGVANYHRVVYEELTADPVGHAERLYVALGLVWNASTQSAAHRMANHSVWGRVDDPQSVAEAWRTELPSEDIERIDELLTESPLASLWG